MFTELAVSLDAPAQFIVPGTLARTMDPLLFVLNTTPLLRLRFYRDGALVGLPANAEITMRLRRGDQWNPSTNLAFQDTWLEVQYGAYYGGDVYYEALFDLSEAAMTSFFGESREAWRNCVGALILDSTEGLIQIAFSSVVFSDGAA